MIATSTAEPLVSVVLPTYNRPDYLRDALVSALVGTLFESLADVARGDQYVPLDEVFSESDFVTLHLPYNKETRHIVGGRQLSRMKKSAYLVNLARGGVLDEDALYQCLVEKRIAGAAIDVLEVEPPRKDHPLLKLDNVLLTPHIGGSTREATLRGERGAAEEVVRVLEGKAPRNPVFPLE